MKRDISKELQRTDIFLKVMQNKWAYFIEENVCLPQGMILGIFGIPKNDRILNHIFNY